MNYIEGIMFFSPRASTRETAQLCKRLAISLDAGIGVRKIWKDEAARATGFSKGYFKAVSEGISQGQSLTIALQATGSYFPLLFRELTAVGEETGRLEAIYHRLADQYEARLKMRRIFLGAIAWPMIQLCLAIGVIGLLIWIMGVISAKPIDMLGFGLYGTRGLTIYCAFIATVATIIWLVIRAINRGLVWTRLIQYLVLRIPFVGKAVEKICLARLVWTFYMTVESGMPIRRAVKMTLRSSGNAFYIDRIGDIDEAIAAGTSLTKSFADARCFPRDFMDALEVGEQSGRLSQTMENLSRQYQDQARSSMAILTTIAGIAVWIMIAGLIIMMIFRLFSFYLGALNSAA
jgi:type II secretory pathway component PulF